MQLKTMHDLLVAQLSELYAAERESLDILRTLEESASAPELSRLFQRHAAEASIHAERLAMVFRLIGAEPCPVRSSGTSGLFEDCIAMSQDIAAEPHVRDVALIAVAQHVEHDEIAGYGCARSWALLLGENEAADLLYQTLREEKAGNEELKMLAGTLNLAAAASTE